MPKISLCLIVGNVEEYIVRCLESFAPIADEICVVRAIGAAPPDRTLEICRTRFGAKTGEYRNAPAHRDWPHVDDFSAARNQSFALATGDFCFWCDSDDVLSHGADLIRQHAERGGYPAYRFPYEIFGKGIRVMRDRMIVRGAARWIFPVHETFEFQISPPTVEDERVIITHLPHLTKTGSNPRNLRILESLDEAEMTTGLLYHYHVELALAERIEDSVRLAQATLARPDLGRPEKYEIFLNLAQATAEPNTKAALLLQAYAAHPGRREALFLLANNSMNFGMPEDGLAYARQMMALPPPEQWQWTDRRAIYGWAGDDMFAQALRANGFFGPAEMFRRQQLKTIGRPRISLLHATRGRPELAAQTRKIWLDMAARPDLVEHWFLFDRDDADSTRLRQFLHKEIPPGGGCVNAWNHGLGVSLGDVVIALSDDWTPPPQWDELLLARLGDVKQPAVLAVSDGHRTDQLLCLAIATRAYLMQDAYFFHPSFTGVYSDNWFSQCAYARKQVIAAGDLVFTHAHPAFGTAEMDATYANQNHPERYREGAAVLKHLESNTDWSSVPGFFDYWQFYDFIADQLKDGDTVVEVGVWMGRSLIYLAQRLKKLGKRVKLFAVDTFVGELNQPAHEPVVAAHGGSLRAVFEGNLARCQVADVVNIIQGDSAASAERFGDGSVAFCYIDAAHDYDSVRRDVAAWLPKITPNGTLAGHDAYHEPVARAVKELIPDVKIIGSVWTK